MRIMIFGRPGSGKTTAAHQLSSKLGIPCFHLDKIFYTSNWSPRPYDLFLTDLIHWVQSEHWIIDGNNSASFDTRWAASDIVIYFNFPVWICLARVFKRYLRGRLLPTDDRAPGCHETIRWNLISYILSFDSRILPKIQEMKQRYPTIQFMEVTHDQTWALFEESLVALALSI